MSDTTFFGHTFSATMTFVLFPAQIIENLIFFKNMSLVCDRPWKRKKLQRFPLSPKRNVAVCYCEQHYSEKWKTLPLKNKIIYFKVEVNYWINMIKHCFFWKFPLHVMEDLKNNSLILKKVGKALNKTTQQLNNFEDYTTIHFWFICRLSNNGRLVVPNCIVFWFKIPPLVTFTLAEAFRPVFSVYELNYFTSMFLTNVSLKNHFYAITLPELYFMQYIGLLLIGCSR